MTNTDDFIWRMVKGCIQLGVVPNINNAINMVPVDHVALCTSLAAVTCMRDDMRVLHIQASPLPTFNSVLSVLSKYGYAVEGCEYVEWRLRLERHAVEDNALFPLLCQGSSFAVSIGTGGDSSESAETVGTGPTK